MVRKAKEAGRNEVQQQMDKRNVFGDLYLRIT
jgi:hypothetical protein